MLTNLSTPHALKPRWFRLELLFWISGLMYLMVCDPSGTPLIDLCPAKVLGIDGCPGCGLGKSIAWLLEGNLSESLKAHLLGPFALTVVTHRIFVLGKNSLYFMKG